MDIELVRSMDWVQAHHETRLDTARITSLEDNPPASPEGGSGRGKEVVGEGRCEWVRGPLPPLQSQQGPQAQFQPQAQFNLKKGGAVGGKEDVSESGAHGGHSSHIPWDLSHGTYFIRYLSMYIMYQYANKG